MTTHAMKPDRRAFLGMTAAALAWPGLARAEAAGLEVLDAALAQVSGA